MKFDFCIGNPPYQELKEDGNKEYAPPVYDKFLEAAFSVADKVEMVHPARFLFKAGSTPKAWNEKMLSDKHFKVLDYHEDASDVFSNTDIKGGIAITYRDLNNEYEPIGVFFKFPELKAILKKVESINKIGWLDSIVFIQNRFNLDILLKDHPSYKSKIGSDGKDSRFEKNIFAKIPAFTDTYANGYIKTLGIFENKRTWKYIDSKYVDMNHENIAKFKIVLSVAIGTGEFGETLPPLCIEQPNEAYTRSFIGIGAFSSNNECIACSKYLKSKFARTMLQILKVTQMANKEVWRFVPLQDFTSTSDIDWSKSLGEIDQQLYKKYKLSDEDITFIESHVKEME